MKNIVKIVCLVALVTSLVACSQQASDQKETDKALVVGMELAYPPFETKDKDGNPDGISVAFMKAFSEYLGRDIVVENISWDGLIPALQTGSVDMVMSSMTITEERAQIVNFSDPYANALLAVLASSNSTIEKIEDLNQEGKKVAVKTGSTGFTYAQTHLPNAEIIALADESACVMEVSQGKVDGFIYDQLTIYRNWQNNLDTTKAIFIPFQDVEKWGIALNQKNNELLTQLNEFIVKYRADGGFDQLSETYLSDEKEAFEMLDFKWFFDIES